MKIKLCIAQIAFSFLLVPHESSQINFDSASKFQDFSQQMKYHIENESYRSNENITSNLNIPVLSNRSTSDINDAANKSKNAMSSTSNNQTEHGAAKCCALTIYRTIYSMQFPNNKDQSQMDSINKAIKGKIFDELLTSRDETNYTNSSNTRIRKFILKTKSELKHFQQTYKIKIKEITYETEQNKNNQNEIYKGQLTMGATDSEFNNSITTDPQFNTSISTNPEFNNSISTDSELNTSIATELEFNTSIATDPEITAIIVRTLTWKNEILWGIYRFYLVPDYLLNGYFFMHQSKTYKELYASKMNVSNPGFSSTICTVPKTTAVAKRTQTSKNGILGRIYRFYLGLARRLVDDYFFMCQKKTYKEVHGSDINVSNPRFSPSICIEPKVTAVTRRIQTWKNEIQWAIVRLHLVPARRIIRRVMHNYYSKYKTVHKWSLKNICSMFGLIQFALSFLVTAVMLKMGRWLWKK